MCTGVNSGIGFPELELEVAIVGPPPLWVLQIESYIIPIATAEPSLQPQRNPF